MYIDLHVVYTLRVTLHCFDLPRTLRSTTYILLLEMEEQRVCSVCNIPLIPDRAYYTCTYCNPHHIVGADCGCYWPHVDQFMAVCDYCKVRALNVGDCDMDNCETKIHYNCRKPHIRTKHKPDKVDIQNINARLTSLEKKTATVEKHLTVILDLLGLEPTQEKAQQLKEHFEAIADKL